jgi:hypothetical protein
MNDLLVLYVGGPAIGLALGYMVYRHLRRARIWRIAVETAARELRLKHVQPEGAISAMYDIAFGEHAGLSISIGIKDESRSGSDTETRYMLLEASGADFEAVIARPGSIDRGYVDYGDEGGDAPTPLGDPEFDEKVELQGAPRALLDALRTDGVFRRQLAEAVRDGTTFDRGRATLKTRTSPTQAGDIVRRVRTLVELSKRIEQLR